MGENKRIRKQIAGWKKQQGKHRLMIAEERAKPQPDFGLIRHWEREMKTWQSQIENREQRLKRKR